MSVIIDYNDFNKANQAAINTGEYQFALGLVNQWLDKYPQDIEAEIYKTQILINNRNFQKGKKILDRILERDPENINGIRLYQKHRESDKKHLSSILFILTGEASNMNAIEPWATKVRALKNEIRKQSYANAEKLLTGALSETPDNIYIALEHANLSLKNKDLQTGRHILEIYGARWPNCIQFKLYLAKVLLELHNESESVGLLHACSRMDPGGLVVRRLFGKGHHFLSIFPSDRNIKFFGEIPTSIALDFNWTRLPSGQSQNSKKFEDINLKTNKELYETATGSGDQSNPEKAYVILSSYKGLKDKYGPKTTDVILDYLNTLSSALERNPRWKPIVFIPDHADYANNFGLKTIDKIDPWKIKLSLMDLNMVLKKSKSSIGAVIIIGNHDVIPFHRLPNPTEDSDSHVLSDNPYATSSSNYLLPEWIIGRLPGEKGNDPGLLMEQIRHITQFHKIAHHSDGIIEKLKQFIQRLKNFGRFLRELLSPPNDFGYSAEVWRRSSIAAFRPIGKAHDLRISPPYDSDSIDVDKLLQAKCVYFNLHGLPTTNEWYGQRDFAERPTGPDFPVAINTEKIKNIPNNIDLAYSEACYGGYINDKNIDDSITLKLLSIGSQGVVGSSCIAYGSVFTPLIGADLLGFIFWKYIKDGFSFGDALKQAKIGLIKVMMQRQGYLDGEDQKTLLSFNLYGDPLGCLEEIIFLNKANNSNMRESQLTLVNDMDGIVENQLDPRQIVTKDIKEVLESYLPGLENAKMRIRKQKIRMAKILNHQEQKIGSNLSYKQVTQIVYEKTISDKNHDHHQYARVTIDEMGKIIKLAISR